MLTCVFTVVAWLRVSVTVSIAGLLVMVSSWWFMIVCVGTHLPGSADFEFDYSIVTSLCVTVQVSVTSCPGQTGPTMQLSFITTACLR